MKNKKEHKQLIDCYAPNCIFYNNGNCKLELVIIAINETTNSPTCQNYIPNYMPKNVKMNR